MTRKEFIAYQKGFEEGLINAYQHIRTSCNVIIKAHRENLSKRRLNELADMNPHLWEKEGKNGDL